MSVQVVLGAAFGDEGKGLATDYYADKFGDGTLVVRFNGGAQALHTVVTPSGKKHVFSHIGSGALAWADTFLSQYFIVNPITFRKEVMELGFLPPIAVDPKCLVTTPYDMILNQLAEMNRENRHGSCGVGIDETIQRSKDPAYLIRVEDLTLEDKVRDTLEAIRTQYFKTRRKKLKIKQLFGFQEYLDSPNLITNFIKDCSYFIGSVVCRGERILQHAGDLIFEGAQGLLLGQGSEFFPYITPSKTGLTNVVKLCRRAKIDEVDVTYVTRAYTTRHGVGPLPFELDKKPYAGVFDYTNGNHEFQGPLRFSYLNLDLITDAIVRDMKSVSLKINPTVMITCLDQISDPFYYIYAEEKQKSSVREALRVIYHAVWRRTGKELKFLCSAGPTRNTVGSRLNG